MASGSISVTGIVNSTAVGRQGELVVTPADEMFRVWFTYRYTARCASHVTILHCPDHKADAETPKAAGR